MSAWTNNWQSNLPSALEHTPPRHTHPAGNAQSTQSVGDGLSTYLERKGQDVQNIADKTCVVIRVASTNIERSVHEMPEECRH